MAFNWVDFIVIAKYLHTSGKNSQIPIDAAYRCATSRAYYAAFCHARDYATARLGFIPTKKPKMPNMAITLILNILVLVGISDYHLFI